MEVCLAYFEENLNHRAIRSWILLLLFLFFLIFVEQICGN